MLAADVAVPAEVLGGGTIAVLGGVGWLLTKHAQFRKYIREQAGTPEVTNTRLHPDNEVVVTKKIIYAPLAEIERLEKLSMTQIERLERQSMTELERIEKHGVTEVERLESYVHKANHALAEEIQLVKSQGQLNMEQSAEDLLLLRKDLNAISVEAAERESRINSKIESSFREATRVSIDAATKVHNRVDAVNGGVSELKGEMKHVAEMIRTFVGRGKS
jgi:hypothetical protein